MWWTCTFDISRRQMQFYTIFFIHFSLPRALMLASNESCGHPPRLVNFLRALLTTFIAISDAHNDLLRVESASSGTMIYRFIGFDERIGRRRWVCGSFIGDFCFDAREMLFRVKKKNLLSSNLSTGDEKILINCNSLSPSALSKGTGSSPLHPFFVPVQISFHSFISHSHSYGK